MTMKPDVSRRGLFTAGAAALAGTMSTRSIGTAAMAPAGKPVLRAAHITDVHITDAKKAPEGVETLWKHLFAQSPQPTLVLNTGDTVMAIDGKVGGEQVETQIGLWQAAAKKCPVPIRSCLGNHDVWGGHEATAKLPAAKAGFGLMTEILGMPAPYYSFDFNGWHFISLNSVSGWPKYGALTAEHFQWLIADLQKTPREMPVCVLSHLPIVSVTSTLYGDSARKGNDNIVPGIWQHSDCWAISEVFRRHPNVKLCISGHMHTQDRCEYRGVWYICGGAASGAWWDGAEYGFPPCYGLIDFFADGTFDYKFVDYGWNAREWKGKELALAPNR
ncbi:MAG: metallophosphoesterase family protein [Gemmataceae bacterium]